MKRVRTALFGVGCLLAGAGPAEAQGPAAGRAVVFSVPTSGEASRFEVPQVRLSDAAVARLINQVLLRGVLGEAGEAAGNVKASPQRQLYQAARACCYDADTRTWAAAGGGLTGSNYTVLLNRSGLLSLRITIQTTGAHHNYETEFLTFDLRTGRLLTLADVVADPPAQLTRRMQGAINRRYGEALALAKTEDTDSASLAYMAEQFYWDWSARRVRWFAGDTSATALALTAPDPELVTFALTPTALLLFHSAAFHRLSQAPEPDDTYRFPYPRLQIRPLLRPLLPATSGKQQPGR